MSEAGPILTEGAVTESAAPLQAENPQLTIGPEQTMAAAAKMMEEGKVRDLPVLREGEIVGLISARDVHMIGTLQDVDPVAVTVEDALRMSIDRW